MKSKGGFLNKGTFKSGKPNKRDNSGNKTKLSIMIN